MEAGVPQHHQTLDIYAHSKVNIKSQLRKIGPIDTGIDSISYQTW